MKDKTPRVPKVKYSPSITSDTQIDIIEIRQLKERTATLDHDPQAPHRVAFNMLIYIRNGNGKHFIDFSHQPFSSNSFVFIRKNQIHAFDLSSDPDGSVILFTDVFIEQIQNSMKMPLFWSAHLYDQQLAIFSPSDNLCISSKRLLEEIRQEISVGQPNSLIVMHLFVALFHMIERDAFYGKIKANTIQNNTILHRFLSLIEIHYTHTRNASDYAEKLHTTYKTLNQLCKKITGKTSKQLIDKYTILEIKRRLTLHNDTVQTLSHEFGFDEVTNFVKYFKKHVNQTPSSFRKTK